MTVQDLLQLAGYPLGIAVLFVVFALLLTGKLRVGSEVERRFKEKDERIAEWKAIAMESIQAGRRASDAAMLLHETGRRGT